VDKEYIAKWEKLFYNVGLRLKDTLLHLEFAPIHAPSRIVLERVAEQINKLLADNRTLI